MNKKMEILKLQRKRHAVHTYGTKGKKLPCYFCDNPGVYEANLGKDMRTWL